MIVTLIRLPLVAPKGSLNNEPTPAIGLAYLASSLREAGFEVHGIDATGQDLNRIVRLADKALQYNGIDAADVIGPSLFFRLTISVLAMIRTILVMQSARGSSQSCHGFPNCS